jgi:Na+-driven multidrug efflux pump
VAVMLYGVVDTVLTGHASATDLAAMGLGTGVYHRFTIRGGRPRWSVLREQVRLGIPMGLSYALEATSFTFITLMVARLGTGVMAGHQVVANLAALCFMVPLAI